MTRRYIRTRSYASDYRFLAAAPAEAWWSSKPWIRASTHMSGVLVEGMGGPWRAYIGGITSERRDKSERTLIRYDLVFEDEDPSPEEADRVCALIARWITAFKEQGSGPPRCAPGLGDVLDEVFPEGDRLEHLLKMHTEKNAAAVHLDLEGVLEHYTQTAPAPAVRSPASTWAAGSTAPGAADMFIAEAQSLMNGKRGTAILGNLLNEEHLPTAIPGERLAVLLGRSDLAWRELPETAPPSPLSEEIVIPPSPPKALCRSLWIAALALILTIILLAILL